MILVYSFTGCRYREVATATEKNPRKSDVLTKIVSDPEGASVFIDGKFVDFTPLQTMLLSSGVLRLELEGFKTITTRLEDNTEGASEVRIIELDLEFLPKEAKEE